VNDPKGYRIEAFEPHDLAPAQLREAALFEQALQHERVPEDPLMDPEAIEARLRASAPGQWRAFSGARDQSGAVVGYSGVFWQTNERGNQHLRWCEIAVAPPPRSWSCAAAGCRPGGRRPGRRPRLHEPRHRSRAGG
jgi:hypothetical protein